MRLVFLGTPEAAVSSLRAIVEAGHDIALVVTRPDRRRGRGGALVASPVKSAAEEFGLRVVSDLDAVTSVGAEAGIVVAYGAMIPATVLDVLPMLNVHFSLLPRWRGAAPVERAILEGDATTGVCVMGLEATLDTGPVYARASTSVDGKDAATLRSELADLGAQLIVDVLSQDPWPEPTPQSGAATYAAKLSAEEFALNPSRPAYELERVVRAGRAVCEVGAHRLIVERAHVEELALEPAEVSVISGSPALGTTRGSLVLDRVKPAGSRSMAASAWWLGAHLDEHVKWSTTQHPRP